MSSLQFHSDTRNNPQMIETLIPSRLHDSLKIRLKIRPVQPIAFHPIIVFILSKVESGSSSSQLNQWWVSKHRLPTAAFMNSAPCPAHSDWVTSFVLVAAGRRHVAETNVLVRELQRSHSKFRNSWSNVQTKSCDFLTTAWTVMCVPIQKKKTLFLPGLKLHPDQKPGRTWNFWTRLKDSHEIFEFHTFCHRANPELEKFFKVLEGRSEFLSSDS